jgi:siroheme synthase-like protein
MEEITIHKNQLYPLFIKADKLPILVIGGGNVALEKVSNILLHSPDALIRIIGKEILPSIELIAENNPRIELIERVFEENDLRNVRFVISALNDISLSEEIGDLVKSKGLLYNAADKPELCDFYLGSVVSKGNLKIGISTNGKSPTMAKRIKEILNDSFPEETDEVLENLYEIRNKLQGDIGQKIKVLDKLTKETSTEITREEVKFNKFVTRLRKKFANLLSDALRIQLVCKGIIREDEWATMKQHIQFDFQKDNYFTELKESEILMNRLATLQQITLYAGSYYSQEWIQKNVLQQSEEDIKEIATQNKQNPPPQPEDQGNQQ